MSDDQNSTATPEQERLIAGLRVILSPLLALAPIVKALGTSLGSCQRGIETMTRALEQHRENMLVQGSAFERGVEQLVAAFGRFDEQAKSASRLYAMTSDAYVNASEELKAAAATHREASAELMQARQEIAELRSMVAILMQRQGIDVAESTARH